MFLHSWPFFKTLHVKVLGTPQMLDSWSKEEEDTGNMVYGRQMHVLGRVQVAAIARVGDLRRLGTAVLDPAIDGDVVEG